MTAIKQLDPPIPVVTPHGFGTAIMVIDYSQEHHLLWVVAQDENGEIWTWPNPEIRLQPNISMGRPLVTKPEEKR